MLFADIKWPATLKDVQKVEKKNNLTINVFGYENETLHPLHLTERTGSVINLLMITKEEDGVPKSHYCWIKDFNKLCYDNNKQQHRKYFCLRCFSSFKTNDSLKKHEEHCKKITSDQPAHTVMPKEGETLSFSNHRKILKV